MSLGSSLLVMRLISGQKIPFTCCFSFMHSDILGMYRFTLWVWIVVLLTLCETRIQNGGLRKQFVINIRVINGSISITYTYQMLSI